MTVLPTTISPGDPGHINHHNYLHGLTNPVQSPFGLAGIDVDTLANLPAAGVAGRQYFDTSVKRLLIDDGVTWHNPTGFVFNVKDPLYGATGDGVTDDTSAFDAAIAAAVAHGGGEVFVPDGTYLHDTLDMDDNVAIQMTPGATMKMIAHVGSHNPQIRMGHLDGTAITNSWVRGGHLNGNKAQQTGPGDEFSPCVAILGSSGCGAEGTEIFNAQGDGVTIGYDLFIMQGANGNAVRHCNIHDNARMQVAITWGNENEICYNRISGAIDLEIDANIGECKNNLIHGNRGRIGPASSLTAPLISDLTISLATLNLDKRYYFGNIVTGNHIFTFSAQTNSGTIFTGNLVVGSNSTQVRLLTLDSFDKAIVSHNILIANTAVATGLTEIIRTRACSYLQVTDNLVDNETLFFHKFIGLTYGADGPAVGQVWKNNNLLGSGNYRDTTLTTPIPLGETALFRLELVNGAATVTKLYGPKGILCDNAGHSAQDLLFTGQGNQWVIEFLPYCSITVGANATVFDQMAMARIEISGISNRVVTMFTAPFSASGPLAQFLFATGTGTFFYRVTV